jgi:hypothetical protein
MEGAVSFPDPVPAARGMVGKPGETNTKLSQGEALRR